MQLFQCQNCGQVLYFENTTCMRCGLRLGYLPDRGSLSAVQPEGSQWIALANPQARYRFCENWERNACNWMLEAGDASPYCRACRHNRTVPDLSNPANLAPWQKIETAKRRLFYSLIRLRLPTPTAGSGDAEPLVFDFLAERPGEAVMTGHDNGVITLSLDEADDAAREATRLSMGEAYRTLLGHFRHEVGHYYWDRLVRDGGQLDGFRALFGDERADYEQALQRHYRDGAPPDWQAAYVSQYATTHPWEDWAETWAHYLHMLDTLEMAGAFGIRIDPQVANATDMQADVAGITDLALDPHRGVGIQALVDAWLPLTYAVNSLNRAMGQPDLYPFVIPPPVIGKLGYIHGLVQVGGAGDQRAG